jgi:DNA-binding beta-propeller fold protein YncE
MKLNLLKYIHLLFFVGLVIGAAAPVAGAELLISDRVSNAVHRYTVDGQYIATLIPNNGDLLSPSGIQLSADSRHLYVASSGNNRVIRYDYSYTQGTATNPVIFADMADGLLFPNSILFSQDGQKIYVSNLGGSGVAQFNLDGTPAGPPILGMIGGTIPIFSGLAYAPNGDILVGGHVNPADPDPFASTGAVGRIDAGFTTLSDHIAPASSLSGVGTMLVIGNDLYVAAGYAGTVSKFDAITGVADPNFNMITGLGFPAGLLAAPDGNGILIGELSNMDGQGSILRYDFDGTLIGQFAPAVAVNGFAEATGLLLVNVPEPTTCVLLAIAVVLTVGLARRHPGKLH